MTYEITHHACVENSLPMSTPFRALSYPSGIFDLSGNCLPNQLHVHLYFSSLLNSLLCGFISQLFFLLSLKINAHVTYSFFYKKSAQLIKIEFMYTLTYKYEAIFSYFSCALPPLLPMPASLPLCFSVHIRVFPLCLLFQSTLYHIVLAWVAKYFPEANIHRQLSNLKGIWTFLKSKI